MFAQTMRTVHNFHPATSLPTMPGARSRRRLATPCHDSYADFGMWQRNSKESTGFARKATVFNIRKINERHLDRRTGF
jgi:hypothetical protein